MKTLFNGRVAEWRVLVVLFPNFTTPFVTAVNWKLDFRTEQTLMDSASPGKIAAWIEGLGA